ncbi:ribulose-phosphate 3-epimerase [Falseniella ignava]|uniref:Ribulose-phosphate 3-epimerase n=1 Tax=Falseniella ignava CCUG 37419 TaxID=883112 RepID=K1LMD8_9LACT|nr:ribulose-phosphate 3-epimerase [Falseniella ignava]EKB55801.1 ribulose-phosphate 3-epimerase [Falseniella ignava CCUG 37419]
MNKIYLCPSMMCANFDDLKSEVNKLDLAGVDIFHIDIMDGTFVPNFAMGIGDIEAVRRNTTKPLDVHLMVSNPGRYIDLFLNMGVDIIYVHPESDPYIVRTIQKIKQSGVKVGIALNPETSIESVQYLLPMVDIVLIMTVPPGFSGQKYLNYIDEKIKYVAKYKAKHDFKIFVDGAISANKIKTLRKIGVDGFVLGTSALFNKEEDYSELIEQYRKY